MEFPRLGFDLLIFRVSANYLSVVFFLAQHLEVLHRTFGRFVVFASYLERNSAAEHPVMSPRCDLNVATSWHNSGSTIKLDDGHMKCFDLKTRSARLNPNPTPEEEKKKTNNEKQHRHLHIH